MGREKNDRRRHEPRHVRLYHSVTGTDAWRALSGNAIKLWIALARMDGGSDNGALFMSVKFGSEMTGLNKDTVNRAFSELQEKGFVVAVQKGHFHVKGGPATVWRLTDRPAPAATPKAPTHDYKGWTGGNISRSQVSAATVPKIGTPLETDPSTVRIIGTAPLETPLVSVQPGIPKKGIQVCYQGDGVSDLDPEPRKQSTSDSGGFRHEADAADEVRGQLLVILNRSAAGKQTDVARQAKIPGGTLSKFLSGKGLARHHLIALQAVVAREAGQSKRRAASAA